MCMSANCGGSGKTPSRLKPNAYVPKKKSMPASRPGSTYSTGTSGYGSPKINIKFGSGRKAGY